MSTVIRPEVSKRSKYYISKHRYYELKHYCLQYPEFKRKYNDLCEKIPGGIIHINSDNNSQPKDESAAIRQEYLDQIQLIENCCELTDPVIGSYIFEAVTKGYTYTYFKLKKNIPCCKETYYNLYRKFFYILDYKKKFA